MMVVLEALMIRMSVWEHSRWIHIHLTSNMGFLALETLQMLKGGMQIYLSKLLNVRISKTN